MNSRPSSTAVSPNWLKRILSLLLVIVMLAALAGCGSSEFCESCGDTPTKGYMNTYYKEKEYYCKYCSSDCAFCPDQATKHYTSGLHTIVFVCTDCYEEILSYNS